MRVRHLQKFVDFQSVGFQTIYIITEILIIYIIVFMNSYIIKN